MANLITTTLLINGSRNFTAKIDITCDTAGDYVNQAILNSKVAIPNVQVSVGMTNLPNTFKIRNITWQLTDFYAKLIWDGATDATALALNQYEGDIDFFEECGVPLIDNSTAPVGQLLITTKGITSTSAGTIIIRGYH